MMAGGPAASEGGGPALGRGREEDGGEGSGHGGQGAGSQWCLGSFEVLSGKEGRTWVQSQTGVRFAERRV